MKQFVESFYVFVGEAEYKFDVYESNGTYVAQSENSNYVVRSRNKESLLEQATNSVKASTGAGDLYES